MTQTITKRNFIERHLNKPEEMISYSLQIITAIMAVMTAVWLVIRLTRGL